MLSIQCLKIRRTLDLLALALVRHRHNFTVAERAGYEGAIKELEYEMFLSRARFAERRIERAQGSDEKGNRRGR